MKALTQAKRDQARARARTSIQRRNGPPPEEHQFRHHRRSKYPGLVRGLVYIILLVPLIAFFSLSAMRLFAIGEEMHRATSADKLIFGINQVPVAGAAIVLGAEFSQILFVIALVVLASERRMAQIAFGIGIIITTMVAFIGNAQYGLWGREFSLFRMLESLSPPVVVLILGEVLALLLLDSVGSRHEQQLQYERALVEWTAIDQNPETHPDWPRAFATALRDELCRRNNLTVDSLTADEWLELVSAELHAEDWYAPELQVNKLNGTAEPDIPPQERALRYLRAHPDIFSELQLQVRTQSEIAADIGVSQSSMSRAYQKLVRNGHEEHEED